MRKDMADCLHHFGYLANRDKGAPIPQECIICLKVLRCIEFNLTWFARAQSQVIRWSHQELPTLTPLVASDWKDLEVLLTSRERSHVTFSLWLFSSFPIFSFSCVWRILGNVSHLHGSVLECQFEDGRYLFVLLEGLLDTLFFVLCRRSERWGSSIWRATRETESQIEFHIMKRHGWALGSW